MDACERELAKAKKLLSSIPMMMLDLDHFKNINDQFGHQAGDALLEEVARGCKSSIRSNNMIGRFGGEEFLVLLPMTTIVEAAVIGEYIRKIIEKLTLVFEHNNLNITVSIGITGIDEPHQKSLDLLIKYTDEVLYQAKKYGRNYIKALTVN